MNRYRYFALFLILVILGGALFPSRSEVESIFWGHFFDSLHFPCFAIGSVAVWYLLHRRYPHKSLILRAFLISAFTAGLIEVIQPLVGRSKSCEDFIVGTIGAAIGSLGIFYWRKNTTHGIAVFTLAIGIFLYILQPAYLDLRVLAWRNSNFPLLSNFEDRLQLRLWRSTRHEYHPSQFRIVPRDSSGSALEVHTEADQYSGVSLITGGYDWRNFQSLTFDLFNPSNTNRLSIRIDDNGDCSEFEYRFNRDLSLQPGWQTIEIPLSDIENGPTTRKLDLSKIARVIFFTPKLPEDAVFEVDEVRLR